jgi:hypothetical protein
MSHERWVMSLLITHYPSQAAFIGGPCQKPYRRHDFSARRPGVERRCARHTGRWIPSVGVFPGSAWLRRRFQQRGYCSGSCCAASRAPVAASFGAPAEIPACRVRKDAVVCGKCHVHAPKRAGTMNAPNPARVEKLEACNERGGTPGFGGRGARCMGARRGVPARSRAQAATAGLIRAKR